MLEIDSQKIVLCENISLVTTDKGVPLKLSGEPQAKGYFEIDEGEDTANSSDTHTATLDSKASQGYEYGEEVEEKIDINDDSLAYELLATNPKHQFNCPDVESGSFIQNVRSFGRILDFLENAIYNTKATLDYDNLKEYESYNTAEYESNNIYAKNKCLSERIKTIYTKDWLSTLAKEAQEAYHSDIHIFMKHWRETLQENHQNIQSFITSFCRKVGCMGLKTKNINSVDNEMNILISDATIEIRSYNAVSLHNQRVQDRLLFLLRQWYIIYHSQHNSFGASLQGYMRYIEINIRYFYVYDEFDKYFYKQVCVDDLKKLRGII